VRRSTSRDNISSLSGQRQSSFVALRNKNFANKSREYTMQDLDKITSTLNSVSKQSKRGKSVMSQESKNKNRSRSNSSNKKAVA